MTAPEQPTGYDFGSLYSQPGAYDVAQVNQMTPVQAFRWYNTHGFLALPAHATEKKLVLPGGYHFDTIEPLSEADITGFEQAWQPGWRVALVMSRASGMTGFDVDDLKQWEKFQAEHEVPATICQSTGRDGGGLHPVFLRPADEEILRADLAGERFGTYDYPLKRGAWSADYPGITVQSKGILIASPSVHTSGRQYQWLPGPGDPAEISTAMLAARRSALADTEHQERVAERRAMLAVDREARRQMDAEGRQPVTLVSAAEVWDQPDMAYLVDGWIPETGIGALFGESGSWKSFIALNLLLCVVYRLGFLGQPVDRPGRCVYLMGEGQAGARRRLRSAIADLPVPPGPDGQPAAPGGLDYVLVPFALSDEQAAGEAIAAIRVEGKDPVSGKDHPVSLVIFDAAADFYGAGDNENSATDMQRIIAACKRISRELGCFVLLVAHTGHEMERMRGTSRFFQAWDFEAYASRDERKPGCGWLEITKTKEDELPGQKVPFHVAKTEQGSLAVHQGHPLAGEGEAGSQGAPHPLELLSPTEDRIFSEVIAYVRGQGGKPLSFRRIDDGTKGNQGTKRRMLDLAVRWDFLAEVPAGGDRMAYSYPGGFSAWLDEEFAGCTG